MRRMISAWVAVIAVLSLTGTAFAAKKWTGSVEGGMALPSGDFGSSDKVDASAGWNLGGSVDYQYRDDLAFGLDGSFGQNKGGLQGTTTDLGGGDTQTIDKDQFNTWNFGGHARYFFPMASSMPVKWYGLIGAGLYGFNENATVTSVVSGVSSSTDFKGSDKRAGMKFGLGGIYWTNPKLGFNGGLDYNVAFLDKDQSPYSSLSYLGAHVGVTFDIPSGSDQP
jgi:hypothetical protein